MTKDKPTPFSDPPYVGHWSNTNIEKAQFACRCGDILGVDIYRSVNTATDSSCQFAALEGSLHRAQCAVCNAEYDLAVPIVFHDPEQKRFALYIPDALLHDEFHLRSELLKSLADHRDEVVPRYVRLMMTLAGVHELEMWVNGRLPRTVEDKPQAPGPKPAGEGTIRAKLKELEERQAEIAHARAEIRKKEAEVAKLAGQNEILSRKLERMEMQSAVPKKGGKRKAAPSTSSPIPPLDEIEGVEEPPLDEMVGPAFADLESEEVASIAPDDLEEIEDSEAIDQALQEELTPVKKVAEVIRPEPVEEIEEIPEPPPELGKSLGSVLARVENGEVALYARLEPSAAKPLLADGSDLWCQLFGFASYPIVTLALVENGEAPEPHGIWWTFDVDRETDRAFLSLLRSTFAARVTLFGPADEFIGRVERKASREVNLSMIMDRARKILHHIDTNERSLDKAMAEFAALKDRTGRRRPPFSTGFFTPPATFVEVRTALDVLSEWLGPRQYEYLIFTRSTPLDQWRAVETKLIERALEFGVNLSRDLQEKALSINLAKDLSDLTLKTAMSFARRTEESEEVPLEEAARNWQGILKAAEEHDVALPKEVERKAKTTMERAGLIQTEDAPLSEATRSRIPKMSREELEALLQRPSARLVAAMELAHRKEADSLEHLFGAVGRMDPVDLPIILPAIAAFGESAGDHLIEMLKSRRPHMRHAAAITLGWLKLRRGLMPVLRQVLAEPTPAWRGMAASVGLYGTGAVRSLLRYLGEPTPRPERLSAAVSYLAAADEAARGQLNQAVSQQGGEVKRRLERGLSDLPPSTEGPVMYFTEILVKSLSTQGPEPDAALVDAIREAVDKYQRAIA